MNERTLFRGCLRLLLRMTDDRFRVVIVEASSRDSHFLKLSSSTRAVDRHQQVRPLSHVEYSSHGLRDDGSEKTGGRHPRSARRLQRQDLRFQPRSGLYFA